MTKYEVTKGGRRELRSSDRGFPLLLLPPRNVNWKFIAMIRSLLSIYLVFTQLSKIKD